MPRYWDLTLILVVLGWLTVWCGFCFPPYISATVSAECVAGSSGVSTPPATWSGLLCCWCCVEISAALCTESPCVKGLASACWTKVSYHDGLALVMVVAAHLNILRTFNASINSPSKSNPPYTNVARHSLDAPRTGVLVCRFIHVTL